MINDGENGVLFKSTNAKQLSKKIIKVLSDNNYRISLGKNAKQTAYKRNYKDFVVKQTIKVYKEILNNGV